MKLPNLKSYLLLSLAALLIIIVALGKCDPQTNKENKELAKNKKKRLDNEALLAERERSRQALASCQESNRLAREKDSIEYAKILKTRHEKKPYNPNPSDAELLREIAELAKAARAQR